MGKARTVAHLAFALPNKVDHLSVVSGLLAEAKVNLIAICVVESGSRVRFRLVVDKRGKARKALSGLEVAVKEEEAVLVEMANKPGRLYRVAKKLSDAGIGIRCSWAASFTGRKTDFVLVVPDAAKAAAAIDA